MDKRCSVHSELALADPIRFMNLPNYRLCRCRCSKSGASRSQSSRVSSWLPESCISCRRRRRRTESGVGSRQRSRCTGFAAALIGRAEPTDQQNVGRRR